MSTLSVSSVSLSGQTTTDFMLMGKKWSEHRISYSFRNSAPDSEYGIGFAPLNSLQQTAVKEALARWASVCDLVFVEVADANEGGVIRFGTCSSSVIATSAAYYPNPYESGGDVWFGNSSTSSPTNPQRGNYAYDTIVHELGHALGLKHPHSTYGVFSAATVAQDAMQNSIMSYRSYLGDSTSGGYSNGADSYAYGPMVYDIAAVQYLYGANYCYNADDTWYRFDASRARIFATVWDGGGTDTYDLSAYSTSVSVDLRPGYWTTSSSGQLAQLNYYEVAYGYSSILEYAPGNIANALLYNGDTRSLIENAIGGSGADTLIGNQTGNALQGGRGNDTLTLGEGADTVLFNIGDGADSISDTAYTAGDLIWFQDGIRTDLAVRASDYQIAVGINGTSDSVAFQRSNQTPAIMAGKELLSVAWATAEGVLFQARCLFYAGTSMSYSDCVKADAASGKATFDLNDTSRFYSVEKFDNSDNITGGSVIRGSLTNNVLTATEQPGATSIGDQLWGRAGNDLLLAGNGSDTLWYGWNEGNDTISGASDADVIRLYNVAGSMVSYSLESGDLLIRLAGSADSLQIVGWATKRARIAVADELTPFTPLTTPATGDTLLGAASEGRIVLDLQAYPGLNHVDNSANSLSFGSVLRGNAGDNVLRAANVGAGLIGDQLWGRTGNDTMIGGSGNDTFWFGKNEGNDVLATPIFANQDKVMLYTALSTSDVKFTANDADLVVSIGTGSLTIVDGLSLVNDNTGIFRLQDGSSHNLRLDEGRIILV